MANKMMKMMMMKLKS